MVRQVQKRNQLAAKQQIGHCLPLRGIQVRAGGVMAAGMNQHDITLGGPLEALQHGLEKQFMSGSRVVRIPLEFEPAASQQGSMVPPGRVAQIYGSFGRGRLDEFRSHSQGAAAARALKCPGAPLFTRCMTGAKHQFLQGRVEFLAAGSADVGFGGLGGQNLSFRPANAFQNRRVARQITINAHPEVDLMLERICSIFRHQAENGIGYQPLKLLKQKLTPLS